MIKKIVRETIRDMVKNKELFTSVDVSNKIKKAGTWISNSDVSAQMKELFNKTYKRYKVTHITVSQLETNRDVSALLYHPKNTDVDLYDNTSAKALTPQEFDDLQKTSATKKAVINKPAIIVKDDGDKKDDKMAPKVTKPVVAKKSKKITSNGRDYSKFKFN